MENHTFSNWAGSYRCRPAKYFEPNSVKEIQDILASARAEKRKVKVVGVGHSPSDICCTQDYMISLKVWNLSWNIDLC